jgi:hypothetical protein
MEFLNFSFVNALSSLFLLWKSSPPPADYQNSISLNTQAPSLEGLVHPAHNGVEHLVFLQTHWVILNL